MNTIVHAILGWFVGLAGRLDKRDRALCLVAGALPDLDGVPLFWSPDLFYRLHRTFGHSLLFGLPATFFLSLIAKRRIRAWPWLLGAFCLHLLCDIVGSDWKVLPLWPLSHQGWTIWPLLSSKVIYGVLNPVVAVIVLLSLLFVASRRGASPLEAIWPKGHEILLRLAQKVFPPKQRT